MEWISQITHQEFVEMQGRADRIRKEVQEALPAKGHQRFHGRELITDEVMRLKSMNDKLMSEYNAAQQGMKRAGQFLHQERHEALTERARLTEEEMYVGNLKNELTSEFFKSGKAALKCICPFKSHLGPKYPIGLW